jgi:hypothetical protein
MPPALSVPRVLGPEGRIWLRRYAAAAVTAERFFAMRVSPEGFSVPRRASERLPASAANSPRPVGPRGILRSALWAGGVTAGRFSASAANPWKAFYGPKGRPSTPPLRGGHFRSAEARGTDFTAERHSSQRDGRRPPEEGDVRSGSALRAVPLGKYGNNKSINKIRS